MPIHTWLTIGLLAIGLTAGCYRTECEITCADGFQITTVDDCEDNDLIILARDHGTCIGEEHKDWWW